MWSFFTLLSAAEGSSKRSLQPPGRACTVACLYSSTGPSCGTLGKTDMYERHGPLERIACTAIPPAVPSDGHNTETSRQHLGHPCTFQPSTSPFPAWPPLEIHLTWSHGPSMARSLALPQKEGSALPMTALSMNHLALNDLLTGEIQAGLEI